VILGLLLQSCATLYVPNGLSGGYWDNRLASNLFEVGFSGNGYTNSGFASRSVFYRSAEVAYENGFRYFVFLEKENSSNRYSYQTQGHGSSRTQLNYDGSLSTKYDYVPGDTVNVSKPKAVVTIKCFVERPGEEAIDAWDVLVTMKVPGEDAPGYEMVAGKLHPKKTTSE
jgi:hypothetical protein